MPGKKNRHVKTPALIHSHEAWWRVRRRLTGAGEEVPAAEQVVGGGSQQILGTA